MSRVYSVKLSETVVVELRAADRVVSRIEIEPILPREELRELLRAALLGRGFEVDAQAGAQADAVRGRGPLGEQIVVDLDDLTVTATLETVEEARRTVTVEGQAKDNRRGAELSARDRLRAEVQNAEAGARTREDQMQEQVSRLLVQGEPARTRLVNEALQDVYAEALKRRAAQMGTIVHQREGTTADGQYELVITVEA